MFPINVLVQEQVKPDSMPSQAISAPQDSAFDDAHDAHNEIEGSAAQRLDDHQV